MNRFLRHISMRLLIVTLVGLPLGFWLLPWVNGWFPGYSAVAIASGFLLLVGLVLGLSLDLVGRKRIQSLIQEGELWERSGISARAEKKYNQAIRIHDSILVSPWSARSLTPLLMGGVARFSLTSGSDHPGFRKAAALYLKANPGDETLGRLWLDQLKTKPGIVPMDQAVLTAMADVHYSNPKMLEKLTEKFLDLGRVDYFAKRLYQGFLERLGPGNTPESNSRYRDRIYALIGEPQDAGENNMLPDPSPIIIPPPTLKDSLGRGRGRAVISFLKKGGQGGAWLFAVLRTGLSKVLGLVREKKKMGSYLRIGFMGFLGVWLLFFVWNTISHMLKSSAMDDSRHQIEVQISKPFTIQVAAYLKQSHADRYVSKLQKKGVTAIIKKKDGGGKTWYLVRVSEFPDKISAAKYGNRLKAQKLIDDFFVSNQ